MPQTPNSKPGQVLCKALAELAGAAPMNPRTGPRLPPREQQPLAGACLVSSPVDMWRAMDGLETSGFFGG